MSLLQPYEISYISGRRHNYVVRARESTLEFSYSYDVRPDLVRRFRMGAECEFLIWPDQNDNRIIRWNI